MKKVMLIAAISTATILGCSKEEIIELEEITVPQNSTAIIIDHIPLALGNYWVYDLYQTDTLGNVTRTPSADSAYVDRDTTINGQLFYIIEGNIYAQLATGGTLRNENNSVLYFDSTDNSEKVSFTTNNPGTRYNQVNIANNMFQLSVWTNQGLQSVDVPLGSFSCHQKETEIVPLTGSNAWGTRSQFQYYNPLVGVISSQFYFASSPDVYELKLIRFHLN
jgi:hypothetical protein